MERDLPIINIGETDFLVDVYKTELRERENPGNVISFFDMKDTGNGYQFDYSYDEKNIPLYFSPEDGISVTLPEMVTLDPVGMARKYNLDLRNLAGKTDFELMVDQDAYQKRVHKGMLPVVDIAGHPFYVDIQMDKLRPKDDFVSKGIDLSYIKYYLDRDTSTYLIPYNPQTHEFQELDWEKVSCFPKGLIAIEFKHELLMDPVGWNRRYGSDRRSGLKEHNVKMNHKATVVPWEKTLLPQIIKENIKKLQVERQQLKREVRKSNKTQRNTRRKM